MPDAVVDEDKGVQANREECPSLRDHSPHKIKMMDRPHYHSRKGQERERVSILAISLFTIKKERWERHSFPVRSVLQLKPRCKVAKGPGPLLSIEKS